MATTTSTDQQGNPPRVAIVGGGPGGLLTAFFLQRAASRPIRTTLFEASRRLGGKVLTPSFAAAPVRYEAGAAEFYDYTPVGDDPLRALVAELGLPTIPLGGAAVLVDGRAIGNMDDLERVLGTSARSAFEAFDARARGAMSPREFYASDESMPVSGGTFSTAMDCIRNPAAYRYVEVMLHSDLATEAAQTSVSYGLQNYLMNDPAYMRLYGIAGGNERLVAALADRLDATVRAGTRVVAVRGVDGGRFALDTEPSTR
ncbi:MAG: FAD-dependent oxidoreductase, partial [Actinomycetota bacterium]